MLKKKKTPYTAVTRTDHLVIDIYREPGVMLSVRTFFLLHVLPLNHFLKTAVEHRTR